MQAINRSLQIQEQRHDRDKDHDRHAGAHGFLAGWPGDLLQLNLGLLEEDLEFLCLGGDARLFDRVIALLAATAEMADHHPETPVITMSMGTLGAVSRLCGEAFGSAMTFANPGAASAPGQVPLDVVNEVLESLHAER